jgi:SAM-dependent methyltransferase
LRSTLSAFDDFLLAPVDPTFLSVQREISLADSKYWKDHGMHELTFWKPFIRIIRERSRNQRDIAIKRCLDVGCLYGTLLIYTSKLGWIPYGVDLENRISPSLMKKYSINYVLTNVELQGIPWQHKFDMILFTEILEHLNFNPLPLLSEIRNRINQDGILLLSTPDRDIWWGDAIFKGPFEELPKYSVSCPPISTDVKNHVKTYNADELSRLMSKAGFQSKIFHFKKRFCPRGHLLCIAHP